MAFGIVFSHGMMGRSRLTRHILLSTKNLNHIIHKTYISLNVKVP